MVASDKEAPLAVAATARWVVKTCATSASCVPKEAVQVRHSQRRRGFMLLLPRPPPPPPTVGGRTAFVVTGLDESRPSSFSMWDGQLAEADDDDPAHVVVIDGGDVGSST